MGNSLSQDSQTVLEAANSGDAGLLKHQIACEPKLLESVTLVKRRSVLHLAAKSGHPHVISTVLEPLLDAVREEYYATQLLSGEADDDQDPAAHEDPPHQQGDDTDAPAGHHHQQQQQQQQEEEDGRRSSTPHPPQPQDAVLSQAQPHAGAQAHPPPPQQPPQQADTPQPQQARTQHPRTQQQPLARARSASAASSSSSQTAPELQLESFTRLRATVNARDLYRRTPLIVAAKRGHLDCTQLLVEAASNMFAVDREGNTGLHYAALHGHAEVVEYLLKRASDRGLSTRFVNKRNLSGFTPLHYAVWSCCAGVVLPLLAAGADLAAVNDRVFDAWVPVPIGSTPLHLAVMRGNAAIALLLLQHYAGLAAAATPPAARGQRRPPDPRGLVNLYGMNPAQLAAHRNARSLAQLLMPSLPLSRVLQVAMPDGTTGELGPPSLRTIAAAAVQQHLDTQLDSLAAAATVAQQAAGSSGKAAHQRCSMVRVVAGASPEPLLSPATSAGDSDQRPDLEIVQDDDDNVGGNSSGCGCSCCDDEPEAPRRARSCPAATAAAAAGGPSGSSDAAGPSGRGGGRPRSSSTPMERAQTRASSSGWYDELCCVCWEAEVSAVLQPCRHALCLGCAKRLVSCSGSTGVTCPLCRTHIAGFESVPRGPGPLQPGSEGKDSCSSCALAIDAAI